ncbi:phosphoglycolate phosphatase [Gayadomonas joobiniege]|uniref:phosphoglycolate phosphatase n=1 Tax=Gayadomonas joobiniege TaxID=1234606 RepID=UPI000373EDD3|nr:phosphoglycolate phosphatase [Gayadomonas joobiniege]
MTTKTTTILFDLDGTLVDSAPDLANSVNATLIQLGREPFTTSKIRNWVGNGAKVLIERALSGQKTISTTLDPQLADKALKLFLHHYSEHLAVDSALYPGVAETLSALKNKGYKLALVTNKPSAFISPLLKGLAIDDYFLANIGGDTLPQKKPAPEPLLHAADLLKQAPQNCVMVGDSKNDILAGKAAGMLTVAVTYGYNYGEDISLQQPDFCFDHFAQINQVF